MKGLEIYPDTLDAQSCNYLINLFNNDDRKTQGKTADGIYEERKKSTDLYCNLDDPQWIEYNKIVAPAVLSMVNKFKYQYQFLNHCAPWKTHRYYNIQYYGDGEGYFLPHCEHSAANSNTTYRKSRNSVPDLKVAQRPSEMPLRPFIIMGETQKSRFFAFLSFSKF